MKKNKETRTYKMTGSPEILNRIERFLSMLHLNGSWGHSGTFCMGFDGDGADGVTIQGIDHAKNKDEVEALSGYGGSFEIIGEGGSGTARQDGDSKQVYSLKEGKLYKSTQGDDMSTKQKPIVFMKAYVKPHTRKLSDGRVVNVGGYNNKRVAKQKESGDGTGDMFDEKQGVESNSSDDVGHVKKGDRVELKPEWMDKGDENVMFIATEDMDGDRVRVAAHTNPPMNITPTSIVKKGMIKKVIPAKHEEKSREKTNEQVFDSLKKHYKLEVTSTGGGFYALAGKIHGYDILVTTGDDVDVPDADSDSFLVGIYPEGEGNTVVSKEVSTISELGTILGRVADGSLPKTNDVLKRAKNAADKAKARNDARAPKESTSDDVTPKQLDIINDQLSNNEDASDSELIDTLVENGISRDVAGRAIAYRDQFFTDPRAKLEFVDGGFKLGKL